MLPDAFVLLTVLMVESVAAFAVNQTLALATVIDHNYPQLGVDLALAVPVTAGGANFHFGGDDQFWGHNGLLAKLSVIQSTVSSNGSYKVFI